MLLSLKIENYALIKHCEISFSQGFSAITGETGAGKSILLGALGLVLGNRAEKEVLLDKEKRCVVEAIFKVDDNMKDIFTDNDLDFERDTIFRREITPLGKSRAFINDTPTQLSVMKLFAQRLIDIHSQSATIDLKDKNFQLSLIDDFLNDKNLLLNYKNEYKTYQNLLKEIQELEEKEKNFIKDKDYYEFLYSELEKASLKEGEQEELEEKVELMSNSEEIKEAISESMFMLDNEEEDNILAKLNNVKNNIKKISSINEELNNFSSRLESCSIELKDILGGLSSFNDKVNFNKEELENDNERLDIIYSLEKKHSVNSIEELLKIEQELSEKLKLNNNISSILEKKQLEKQQIVNNLQDLSNLLHKQRIISSKEIEENVKPLLTQMAMKEAELKIEVNETNDFTENGKDSVRFLFNANKTKERNLMEMSKVVSGGELSRLMLAIKAVICQRFSLPTMVFDEIDSGISGDIAAKVADIMSKIGEKHQVIAITHLVQMAAKAKHQFKVYKQIENNETISNISLLNKEERVNEIAMMLSNDKITKEAIANAKSLLG